jgi:hypothetical protein
LPTLVHSKIRRGLTIACLAAAALVVRTSAWQQDHQDHALSETPLPESGAPLRKALLLLREGKTTEEHLRMGSQNAR